jgi:hypothetical protein
MKQFRISELARRTVLCGCNLYNETRRRLVRFCLFTAGTTGSPPVVDYDGYRWFWLLVINPLMRSNKYMVCLTKVVCSLFMH